MLDYQNCESLCVLVFAIDSVELLAVVVVLAIVIVAAIVVSYYVGVDVGIDVGVGSSFASLEYLPGFGSSKFLHLVVIVVVAFSFSFHIDNIHLPLDIN